jgi:nitroreductase
LLIVTIRPFVDLAFQGFDESEMQERSEAFYQEMRRRRTVREFSTREVPREIIERCLLTAGSAVSGANMQPWQFVVIQDAELKHRIRIAAEKEEKAFYEGKAPREWLEALAPLGTDSNKPFLENAPYLIAIFQQRFGVLPDGSKVKHYYATESVGIATGLLISAIHHAGLASLTHTPSPMGFLNEILGRPKSERPFLLLVVGYPDENARVPDIGKKSLAEIATFL